MKIREALLNKLESLRNTIIAHQGAFTSSSEQESVSNSSSSNFVLFFSFSVALVCAELFCSGEVSRSLISQYLLIKKNFMHQQRTL